MWRIGTRQIDQHPPEAAAIFHAAALMAARLSSSAPQLVAALQAHALKGRANALRHLGRFDDALSDLRVAAALFAKAQFSVDEAAQVEYTRGTVLLKMDRWDEAADAARAARRLFMRTTDVRRLAHADVLLAVALFEKGSWDDAREIWLDLERRLTLMKDREALARVWQNLAVVEIRRGRPQPARGYLNRASAAFRALGNQTELVRTRWNMATYLATFRGTRAGICALRRVRERFEALGVYVDAACVGLEIVELLIPVAPQGDAELTRYALDVASVLVRAGLAVSTAAALDQLRRIAVARNRRAIVEDLRLARREVNACHHIAENDGGIASDPAADA